MPHTRNEKRPATLKLGSSISPQSMCSLWPLSAKSILLFSKLRPYTSYLLNTTPTKLWLVERFVNWKIGLGKAGILKNWGYILSRSHLHMANKRLKWPMLQNRCNSAIHSHPFLFWLFTANQDRGRWGGSGSAEDEALVSSQTRRRGGRGLRPDRWRTVKCNLVGEERSHTSSIQTSTQNYLPYCDATTTNCQTSIDLDPLSSVCIHISASHRK